MDSLPFPSAWKIFMNGVMGDLIVQSVNEGVVTGTISDPGNPIQTLEAATWNEAAKQLQFARTLRKDTPTSEYQAFTGYLYDFDNAISSDITVAGIPPVATFAGTFTAAPYESRPDFGWIAFYLRIEV